MYTEFYGLNEKPFSITPDPRYLYLTDRHADALAHLIYGISESGGFIQLTGEVGTGKTTLIRSLLEQMPTGAKVAVILNPNLTATEFLIAICEELQIPLPDQEAGHYSKSTLIGALNAFLLNEHAAGTRVVLVVDEAQTLDAELLEQVRLLTNLETAKQKLLQIILIGQPELRDLLRRADMRQVAQRITGRFHLEPLGRNETSAYVGHRMKVAGSHREVFRRSAMRELFRQSSGIPRLINVVADRALLAGYTLDSPKIDGKLVRRAAREVFGRPPRRWWLYPVFGAALAVGVLLWQPWSSLVEPADISVAVASSIDETVPEAIVESSTPQPIQRSKIADLFGVDSTASGKAYRDLLGAHGIDLEPTAKPACRAAVAQQLSCVRIAGGSLGRLKRLDKPVVVSLTGPAGRPLDVLLESIDADGVTVDAAGHDFQLTLDEFGGLWGGFYVELWRPLPPSQTVLRVGSIGDDVTWVRRALASVYERALSEQDETAEFDDELAESVREYQRDRGLIVDGVVGIETQAALRADLGLAGTQTDQRG